MLGLYGQIMAMQWIKDNNIHFFGGNPDDITVRSVGNSDDLESITFIFYHQFPII